MAFFEDKKERLSRFLSETSFFISSTCNRLDRILRETIRGAHPGNMFCFGFSTRRKATPKMDIEGGRGTDRGVSYSYRLAKKSWFANYECRVNRALLDGEPREIYTTEFTVGGSTWCVCVKHRQGGTLGAYLYSTNNTPVTAHYSFSLLNHSDPKKRRNEGNCKKFLPNKNWGYDRLETISAIKHPASGFLVNDVFVVQLEIRLIQPENESYSFCSDGTSGVFVWKLRHLHDMSPWTLKSEEFCVNGTKWYLRLYPRGRSREGKYMSVLFASKNDSPVRANFKLTAHKHKTSTQRKRLEYTYTYEKVHKGRVCPRFLKLKSLEEEQFGYVRDGWLTLVGHISLEEQPLEESFDSQQDTDSVPLGRSSEEDPLCIFCLVNPQTSGVLHGNTTHKCYCLPCAQKMAREKNLKCPLCRMPVDRVIEKFY